MNKKVGIIAVLLIVAMCFAMTGCSALTSMLKVSEWMTQYSSWKPTATYSTSTETLTVKWDKLVGNDYVTVSAIKVIWTDSNVPVANTDTKELAGDATTYVTKISSAKTPITVGVVPSGSVTIFGQKTDMPVLLEVSPIEATVE